MWKPHGQAQTDPVVVQVQDHVQKLGGLSVFPFDARFAGGTEIFNGHAQVRDGRGDDGLLQLDELLPSPATPRESHTHSTTVSQRGDGTDGTVAPPPASPDAHLKHLVLPVQLLPSSRALDELVAVRVDEGLQVELPLCSLHELRHGVQGDGLHG